jgi:hypothetical protein
MFTNANMCWPQKKPPQERPSRRALQQSRKNRPLKSSEIMNQKPQEPLALAAQMQEPKTAKNV